MSDSASTSLSEHRTQLQTVPQQRLEDSADATSSLPSSVSDGHGSKAVSGGQAGINAGANKRYRPFATTRSASAQGDDRGKELNK